jgi:hypothetical protein
MKAAVPEGMNTEGKCPRHQSVPVGGGAGGSPHPEDNLPAGGVFSTITDDMGASRDFGSPDYLNNPSIERRTNPVARLFKAFGAWHFLTRIGSVLLILGAVNVVVSVALSEDVGRARLWLFYGVVLVCLGVWRKRRATSHRVDRLLQRPPRGRPGGRPVRRFHPGPFGRGGFGGRL